MGWAARPGRAIAFFDWSGGREWVWALALTGGVLSWRRGLNRMEPTGAWNLKERL